jgi:D-aspartate ligase
VSPAATRRALPAAIVLGGGANALSIARSLGPRGVAVHLIGTPRHLGRSRHCRYIDVPVGTAGVQASWLEYLLGPRAAHLAGAVLLPGSDDGIEAIARNRPALAERFRLDETDPQAQLVMLDKLETYRRAQEVGIETPLFWVPRSDEELLALEDRLVFPLLVKPRLSHEYQKRFTSKFVVAGDLRQAREAFSRIRAVGVDVMLVEQVPGGDENICSYFTYLDDRGEPAFDFTKRVIRRYPEGMGAGCYHVTDWAPERREPALRLLRHVGVRGIACVEFKRDPRDGRLKLIECNARFNATDCLLTSSGFDMPAYIYGRVIGAPRTLPGRYEPGLRLWNPLQDFRAYRERARAGTLTFPRWVRSVLHRQTFFYFRWDDPGPTVAAGGAKILRLARRSAHQRRGATPAAAGTAERAVAAGAPGGRPE